MKLWKKLLASVGVAGALAAPSAHAAGEFLFLQLFTADAADTTSTMVAAFNLGAPVATATDGIKINGIFNGWNITSEIKGSVFSVNPLSMEIKGTAFRATTGTGTVTAGTGGLIPTPGCAGTLNGVATEFCNLGGSFVDTNASPFVYQYNAGTVNNSILKIRLGLANYSVPTGGTKFDDTLSFSAPKSSTAGDKATQQIDTSGIGGGVSSLGVVNFPVVGTSTGTTSVVSVAPFAGTGSFVFGFDLLSNNTQNPALGTGEQFSFTNSIVEIPEPGTLALLGLALVGVAAARRKSVIAA